MSIKCLLCQFRRSFNIQLNINTLHANLLEENRHTPSDLHIRKDKVFILNDLLRLRIIGNIPIIVNPSGKEPCACLFAGSPGNQNII